MSKPTNLFKHSTSHQMSSLTALQQQVLYWQKLSKLIQPLLPQPEHWQVVCYQSGVLTVAGHNQAMISQLNYLHTQYLAQLRTLPPFQHLVKLHAILNPMTAMPQPQHKQNPERMLDESTQKLLHDAANSATHPAIKRALTKLSQPKTSPID